MLQQLRKLIALGTLISSGLTLSAAAINTTKDFSFKNWPAKRGPGKVYENGWSPHDAASLEATIVWTKRCFEPLCLSQEAALSLELKVACSPELLNPNAHPLISIKGSNTAPAADRFYCEQAILDGVLCTSHPGDGTIVLDRNLNDCADFDCAKLFFAKHPDLKGKVVVAHILPAALCFIQSDLVSESEIHSRRNLRAIRIEELDSDQFKNWREEWLTYLFIHQHDGDLTRSQLLKDAADISRRHSRLFLAAS